jgi:hypothetical protein
VTDATFDDAARAAVDTPAELHDAARAPSPLSAADARHRPALGKRLKIRSMVAVSGEVLPFFWPMRNFIHHNPLHGLEHLPFEAAVAEATRLFHARGWLPRPDYQRMLADGALRQEDVAAEIDAFVSVWLAEHGPEEPAAEEQVGALLRRILLAMMTATSQPSPGDREPCAEAVLACLRREAGQG